MFKPFRLVAGTALVAVFCVSPSLAASESNAVVSHCEIVSSGQRHVIESCLVSSQKNEQGMSFTLQGKDEKPLLEEISLINIDEVSPGLAEVRGLTTGGINSRWGEARHEGSCWAGSDFRICIRNK